MMQILVASYDWRIKDTECVVVCDGINPLIGRELSDDLGIKLLKL